MATNEELAIKIKAGETELIPQLWEQVFKFIKWKAKNYYTKRLQMFGDKIGCEEGDLIQAGYFAMLEAIKGFEENKGYSFLSSLKFALKSTFSEIVGIHTTKRDAILYADSLDRPIAEETDGTLLDVIPDKASENEGSVEEVVLARVYQSQLHKTLEKSIDLLTEQQQVVIRARYYKGSRLDDLALLLDCSKQNVSRVEQNGLKKMYDTKSLTGLDYFLDENTNYYFHIRKDRFKTTLTSSVEEIVLRREALASKWLQKKYGLG